MTKRFQLDAWSGDFGNAYVERSLATRERVRKRTFMWGQVLRPIIHAPPSSVVEIGANVGINLRALNNLIDADYYAIEPNERAREILSADNVLPKENIFANEAGSIPLEDGAAEMGITCGVLIHIAPDNLLKACSELHRVSSRYIASIEYFSDKPEEVEYRGQDGLLFKRDFGAFWLENFDDLRLIDYGFLWRTATGFDNSTWWLFEKRR